MTDENIPMPWLDTLEGVRRTHLEYRMEPPFTFVKERATNEPDDIAIIPYKGKPISYAELLDGIKRMHVALRNLGVKKGDRVAIMLPNIPQYIIAHYAILSLGGIVVQTNPLYTERELNHQMNDSGATVMITFTLLQEKAHKVMDTTPVEKVIVTNLGDYMKPLVVFLGKLLKKLDDPKFKPYPNHYKWTDLMDAADLSQFKEEEVNVEEDVAILQYTGGTTGVSKGAMLTHANVSINAQQAREIFNTVRDKEGSLLTVLPMFHSFGLTACMNMSFQLGVPVVLMPKFIPKEALKLIEKHRITFFPAVPAMLVALLNDPTIKEVDLSSLRAVISGGAPLPVEVARQFEKATDADLVEGYGLSETSPVAYANPVGSEKIRPKIGSIGLPAPDTLAKIVDTEDYSKTLPIGEVGEICLKGPQVMKGYWNRPEETAKTLIDGWLRTGDIAKIDEEGFAYIVDRKKDLIIVSGYNVVPREVEEVLYEYPKIKEAAVAGLSHPKKGEMVAAWVVLKDGEVATKDEILDFLKENLAPYKLPKEIFFKDDLPKSMIGKVLRRKLREEYESKAT